MSDIMGVISFDRLLDLCLMEYNTKGKIMEIEEKYFYSPKNKDKDIDLSEEYMRLPIGPAAGPHTQLSQNILSAYLMGARFFELKTIQKISGKEMQNLIKKPCIDMRNVGYNTEWSTELTIKEATEEYVKASILLQVIAIELSLSDCKDFVFNMSVGYSFEGIRSKEVSDFIDDMKQARDTEIYKQCINVLKNNINKFKRFNFLDIEKISSNIVSSITTSTLHGCKPEEIVEIGTYLISNKKLNTYIKLNPTLLGYKQVRNILDNLGYKEVVIREEDFENDMKYVYAVEIMTCLLELGKEVGVTVGIKMTNTLPVYNSRKILQGETMYLSGKPLYPIALGVAEKFAKSFNGEIPISFSGGIDQNNIIDVLRTGIAPITFSTILLKPRGYINMKSIVAKLDEEFISLNKIDVEELSRLAISARIDDRYKNKGDKKIFEDTLPTYDCFKINCGICVDVCPNRANIKIYDKRFSSPYQILHIENRCNECDNCHTFCPKGGFPYYKKITLYKNLQEFHKSKNPGILKTQQNTYLLRNESGLTYSYDLSSSPLVEEQNDIEKLLQTLLKDYPYLI